MYLRGKEYSMYTCMIHIYYIVSSAGTHTKMNNDWY